MKSSRPYLLLLIALLVGWAVGLYSTQHFYDKWIRRYETHNAFEGVKRSLTALNALHAGDTNGAEEMLESQLNSHIQVLVAMIQNVPAGQLQPQNLRILTQLHDYRAAYPRKDNGSEIDKIIAGVLSSTNIQSRP
jgi:hypothetical protein